MSFSDHRPYLSLVPIRTGTMDSNSTGVPLLPPHTPGAMTPSTVRSFLDGFDERDIDERYQAEAAEISHTLTQNVNALLHQGSEPVEAPAVTVDALKELQGEFVKQTSWKLNKKVALELIQEAGKPGAKLDKLAERWMREVAHKDEFKSHLGKSSAWKAMAGFDFASATFLASLASDVSFWAQSAAGSLTGPIGALLTPGMTGYLKIASEVLMELNHTSLVPLMDSSVASAPAYKEVRKGIQKAEVGVEASVTQLQKSVNQLLQLPDAPTARDKRTTLINQNVKGLQKAEEDLATNLKALGGMVETYRHKQAKTRAQWDGGMWTMGSYMAGAPINILGEILNTHFPGAKIVTQATSLPVLFGARLAAGKRDNWIQRRLAARTVLQFPGNLLRSGAKDKDRSALTVDDLQLEKAFKSPLQYRVDLAKEAAVHEIYGQQKKLESLAKKFIKDKLTKKELEAKAKPIYEEIEKLAKDYECLGSDSKKEVCLDQLDPNGKIAKWLHHDTADLAWTAFKARENQPGRLRAMVARSTGQMAVLAADGLAHIPYQHPETLQAGHLPASSAHSPQGLVDTDSHRFEFIDPQIQSEYQAIQIRSAGSYSAFVQSALTAKSKAGTEDKKFEEMLKGIYQVPGNAVDNSSVRRYYQRNIILRWLSSAWEGAKGLADAPVGLRDKQWAQTVKRNATQTQSAGQEYLGMARHLARDAATDSFFARYQYFCEHRDTLLRDQDFQKHLYMLCCLARDETLAQGTLDNPFLNDPASSARIFELTKHSSDEDINQLESMDGKDTGLVFIVDDENKVRTFVRRYEDNTGWCSLDDNGLTSPKEYLNSQQKSSGDRDGWRVITVPASIGMPESLCPSEDQNSSTGLSGNTVSAFLGRPLKRNDLSDFRPESIAACAKQKGHKETAFFSSELNDRFYESLEKAKVGTQLLAVYPSNQLVFLRKEKDGDGNEGWAIVTLSDDRQELKENDELEPLKVFFNKEKEKGLKTVSIVSLDLNNVSQDDAVNAFIETYTKGRFSASNSNLNNGLWDTAHKFLCLNERRKDEVALKAAQQSSQQTISKANLKSDQVFGSILSDEILVRPKNTEQALFFKKTATGWTVFDPYLPQFGFQKCTDKDNPISSEIAKRLPGEESRLDIAWKPLPTNKPDTSAQLPKQQQDLIAQVKQAPKARKSVRIQEPPPLTSSSQQTAVSSEQEERFSAYRLAYSERGTGIALGYIDELNGILSERAETLPEYKDNCYVSDITFDGPNAQGLWNHVKQTDHRCGWQALIAFLGGPLLSFEELVEFLPADKREQARTEGFELDTLHDVLINHLGFVDDENIRFVPSTALISDTGVVSPVNEEQMRKDMDTASQVIFKYDNKVREDEYNKDIPGSNYYPAKDSRENLDGDGNPIYRSHIVHFVKIDGEFYLQDGKYGEQEKMHPMDYAKKKNGGSLESEGWLRDCQYICTVHDEDSAVAKEGFKITSQGEARNNDTGSPSRRRAASVASFQSGVSTASAASNKEKLMNLVFTWQRRLGGIEAESRYANDVRGLAVLDRRLEDIIKKKNRQPEKLADKIKAKQGDLAELSERQQGIEEEIQNIKTELSQDIDGRRRVQLEEEKAHQEDLKTALEGPIGQLELDLLVNLNADANRPELYGHLDRTIEKQVLPLLRRRRHDLIDSLMDNLASTQSLSKGQKEKLTEFKSRLEAYDAQLPTRSANRDASFDLYAEIRTLHQEIEAFHQSISPS